MGVAFAIGDSHETLAPKAAAHRRGDGSVEYALLIVAVVVVCAGAMRPPRGQDHRGGHGERRLTH